MKLSAGQQWKHRHREETYGHGRGRKERVGCTERVTGHLPHVEQPASGDVLDASGNANWGSVST